MYFIVLLLLLVASGESCLSLDFGSRPKVDLTRRRSPSGESRD